MLPKNRRLTIKDFKEIFDRGKIFRGRYFIVRISPMPEVRPSIFGFSVPKKAFKNASDRNKYRRRGYSVISKVINNIKPSYKCLFIMGKPAQPPSFEGVRADILSLVDSAGLIGSRNPF